MRKNSTPEWLPRYQQTAIILLSVFYLVGVIGHWHPATLPAMLVLTPYTLAGTAVVGFLPFVVEKRYRLLAWAGATFIVTLALEIVGVATGWVFGSYDYGATLGSQVLGAPLLIGINWTLVILGALAAAERLTGRPVPAAVIAALLCVVFDYIMEPAAIALDYWSWEGDTIPLQNYLAWGVIALVFAGLFKRMRLTSNHPLPLAILIVQGLFFLLLRWVV